MEAVYLGLLYFEEDYIKEAMYVKSRLIQTLS